MKLLASLAMLLALAAAAPGQPAASGSHPVRSSATPHGIHPAVVRIIAPERGGMSLGSGALVAVHGDHGLVVTNWHVVRDATGTVQVAFPNGFRSPASVLKVDRVWDLAALAIWRPNVEPIRLASQPPRPGEPLTIAGYGGGTYRAVGGKCTQYVAPDRGQPFEMVELSVAARQGDSGGPILNQHGELAGVLFGSGLGCTSGSYCGRVQRFLATVESQFDRLAPNPLLIAQRPSHPAPAPSQSSGSAPSPDAVPWQPPSNYWAVVPPSSRQAGPERQQPPTSPSVVASIATQGSVSTPRSATSDRPAPAGNPLPVSAPSTRGIAEPVPDPASPLASTSPTRNEDAPELTGPTMAEQLKTILAGIGVFALFFHSIRVFALASEPQKKRRTRSK